MNLILSDVEETIMLVDGAEGTPHGQGVVNVSSVYPLNSISVPTQHAGSKKEDGHAFRQRRWGYLGMCMVCGRIYISVFLTFSGITSFADVIPATKPYSSVLSVSVHLPVMGCNIYSPVSI